ncbi:MAG: hypothetical protein CM15mP77_0820 [Synechococcus sp.]|nr:MAG: hypothetical protein CM15mP77_0820 [Synechococcus sp.]
MAPPEADRQGRHLPAVARNRVVLDATDFMPEQQVAVIQRHGIPGIKINLNLHLITTDFLERD